VKVRTAGHPLLQLPAAAHVPHNGQAVGRREDAGHKGQPMVTGHALEPVQRLDVFRPRDVGRPGAKAEGTAGIFDVKEVRTAVPAVVVKPHQVPDAQWRGVMAKHFLGKTNLLEYMNVRMTGHWVFRCRNQLG
jgi:hypothetical protein